jgi:hypothetical protein
MFNLETGWGTGISPVFAPVIFLFLSCFLPVFRRTCAAETAAIHDEKERAAAGAGRQLMSE